MRQVLVTIILILISLNNFAEMPKLLIKMPTRSRPAKFLKNLDKYYQNMSFEYPYEFLITCDEDDASMNNENVIKRLQSYPNLKFYFSKNNSKVEAVNKDIEKCDFDILLVASDDMEPIVRNFDKIIIETMQKNFADFDGVLNFNDGHVGGACNTLPVIGKKFYDRFKYVYNPAYKAFECNVELALVSKILKKEKVINDVIIQHNHPAWGKNSWDDLYQKNQHFYAQDTSIFITRQKNNFDLTQEELISGTPKDLSILICTLDERASIFENLFNKLNKQIKDLGLQDKVEVLYYKDNREVSVGTKRNSLLEQASGKYTCFADDDDDVHDDYIKMLHDKLKTNPDCVSLVGTITTNGSSPKRFIHSLRYKSYSEDAKNYYRPPNHLNVIKRSLAIQFHFPEKYYGEDFDWAMQVCRSGLLKTEEVINEPYYFYLYRNYTSQVGQDKYLNEHVFKNKKNGVFVDIGAFDGISHSNSYYFEKNLNWSGICIEPLPNKFKELKSCRNCKCINACISNEEGIVKFFEVNGAPAMLSGMVRNYDPRHLVRLNNEIARDGGSCNVIEVPSLNINNILRENNITKVDYLSLDTEGAELEILKSIDFDSFYIHAISVENNYSDESFKLFLESKGFKLVTTLGNQDEIYINNH
ncbi:MAG: FkbM family methyltransferase [Candidatus Babeliales bacterium]|nr:FkbM family methyltransferase [Candidatus Babeliales bacterium]